MEAVGNYDELLKKPGVLGTEYWVKAKAAKPELPDDLRVHKPYIDYVEYDSPFARGARMRRVPEVIDCWYDSGAMPFAQWGYPNTKGSHERFQSQFPADFISEAIDQTRGWFYSLLAISTLMWGENDKARMPNDERKNSSLDIRHSSFPFPHPYRNCIVLGLMLGEDGQKMSKSKRNYLPPNEIFDKYGADALRWYFFASQPPWTSIRYSEQSIKDSIPEFLLRLWNVYSFFVIYANIDGFDPAGELASASGSASASSISSLDPRTFTSAKSFRPVQDRRELDRWILSELNRTVAAVVERMDVYDNFAACGHITEFVDALSNWYVRRSRDRFWAADKRGVEKLDAYWTLYECLVTTAKLVAPFVPFVAETLWQNLAGIFKGAAAQSVHLCDYPRPDTAVIDEVLSVQMNLVRLISSLGRNARTSAALKVRQPLSKVEVVLADATHQKWLEAHADVINEELNVKQLEFSDDPSLYVDHEVNPNFKLLGPKLGKLLPKVKAWLATQSGAELLANIRDNGLIDLEIDGQKIALTREEVEVRIKPKPGWTSANDRGVVVVLSTELTPELIAEGTARDVVRAVQDARKETACDFTDRIELGIVVAKGELLSEMLAKFGDYIQNETLAQKILSEPLPEVKPIRAKIGETEVDLYIRILR
jgi:isoleucyl-tRNA synthetase